VITLKGKGLPRLKRGPRRQGDQFCKVILDMPVDLDDATQKQMLTLDRALSGTHSPVREVYERILASARSDSFGDDSP
jgi:DnaJ-class molecular chaperone